MSRVQGTKGVVKCIEMIVVCVMVYGCQVVGLNRGYTHRTFTNCTTAII